MNVLTVVRTFQPGAGEGGKVFDPNFFAEKTGTPLERYLATCSDTVLVVVNAEPGRLGERRSAVDSETPSSRALKTAFAKEIKQGRLIVKVLDEWGPNNGSTIPLNLGLQEAKNRKCRWLFAWSPEMDINWCDLKVAISHAEKHHLQAVGFLRKRWWQRSQWLVIQNTAALWDVEALDAIGGFDDRCNGTGRTLYIKIDGCDSSIEVPIAGMEDFHALLRLIKEFPDSRWGMVGRAHPREWHTDFPVGSQREREHLIKVARQYSVMEDHCQDVYPDVGPEIVLDKVFSCCHID